MNKNHLALLIETEVDRLLREQEEGDAPSAPEPPEDVAGEEPGETGEGEADAAGAEGEADLEGGTTGAGMGDLEGAEGEEGLEGAEGDEMDTGAAGGGFGGFGGGGGSAFGDEGEAGTAADEPEEEDTLSTIGPEDVEIPADPVMAITDDAIQMLNQTQQPSRILQNVKSSIQRYFPEPIDATPIIKALWDTEDLVLRDVARRLLLFIKGA